MEVLISIVVLALAVVFVFELASFIVHGWFINSKDLNDALDQHIPKGTKLNPYESHILSIGEMPFISSDLFSLLGPYYVDEVGRVWRFSKAHKRIKEIYKSKQSSVRSKLNID